MPLPQKGLIGIVDQIHLTDHFPDEIVRIELILGEDWNRDEFPFWRFPQSSGGCVYADKLEAEIAQFFREISAVYKRKAMTTTPRLGLLSIFRGGKTSVDGYLQRVP